jgi:hypothetical protein
VLAALHGELADGDLACLLKRIAEPTSYGADDEQVPWVPDSKARQYCLVRQYSG